ncbi:uncharacterized protein BDZ99DRAFT_567642 [Mytilinidion resinicola]|uniref:Protein HRI1 n=1 Tax=Mytilinidion resinicola TaxID=574789 RepID=A0A6A6YZL0_9PEZI|nr:uncharacterized protein BDZ99DRAFT_567642 [Mytilinidion resinicola]KAF2813929.1 hypothetical protein BDZ99DRAFT_567642 [Mytilinidion resinicola]
MSMPNISVREYICWQGDTPSEPTSTLVTTSKENYYVDIRIYKRLHLSDPELPLPNNGGPIHRLEWAFAGLSESWAVNADTDSLSHSLAPTSSNAPQPKNARWWHWLDSHYALLPAHWLPTTIPYEQYTARARTDDPFIDIASPTFSTASTLISGEPPAATTATTPPLRNFAPVLDAGVLHPVPHDAALTLETGVMTYSPTGLQTPYEEMWRDVAATAADVGTEAKYSVVLTLEMPLICARGMVVRVGQWCQGVLMIGAQVTCERWEFVWEDGKKGRDGEWVRRVRLGDGFLPTGVAFRTPEVKVGNTCKNGDMVWVVREKFEWSG